MMLCYVVQRDEESYDPYDEPTQVFSLFGIRLLLFEGCPWLFGKSRRYVFVERCRLTVLLVGVAVGRKQVWRCCLKGKRGREAEWCQGYGGGKCDSGGFHDAGGGRTAEELLSGTANDIKWVESRFICLHQCLEEHSSAAFSSFWVSRSSKQSTTSYFGKSENDSRKSPAPILSVASVSIGDGYLHLRPLS